MGASREYYRFPPVGPALAQRAYSVTPHSKFPSDAASGSLPQISCLPIVVAPTTGLSAAAIAKSTLPLLIVPMTQVQTSTKAWEPERTSVTL